MKKFFLCSGLGLALAAASSYCTWVQASMPATPLSRIALAVAVLCAVFSMLIYAWTRSIPALGATTLPRVLAAFGCGLAFCMCGGIIMMIGRFSEAGVHIGWSTLLRAVNVPWLVTFVLLFSGIIYERWFKPVAVRQRG